MARIPIATAAVRVPSSRYPLRFFGILALSLYPEARSLCPSTMIKVLLSGLVWIKILTVPAEGIFLIARAPFRT